MLKRETFTGPWAGLPVAWHDDGSFDGNTYRSDIRRCCEAGIPGIYTGGTTGEFYAIEIDEFPEITKATIEECHAHNTPAMIGVSATSTRGAVRRAEIARDLGADAIQVTLPFWMEVSETEIVPFFQTVSEASGNLPFSIYETLRCKTRLNLKHHRQIKVAVPEYMMVKSNAGTLGDTVEGCAALSEFVNVFVPEVRWGELVPAGAAGACSAMVYWRPELVLGLWNKMSSDSDDVTDILNKVTKLHAFLAETFAPRGFTDTAYDRLLGKAVGILETSLQCRAPYPYATGDDIETIRNWCRNHFPGLLSFPD